MAEPVTRIFSDVHYGDRVSRVRALPDLRPLFEGADALILNGDTIDTRPSKHPAATEELRAETLAFFHGNAPPVTLVTGNHDADISAAHHLDLGGGRVFVTHGDIIFDDLVPWGQDAAFIRRRIAEELGRMTPAEREALDPRLGAFRRVAASIPQRHQSERNPWKYAFSFVKDTVWPPLRFMSVIQAWRQAPGLAAELTRRHRPNAGFIVFGHIHRPGIWRLPNGIIAINTGSFGPPVGPWLADVTGTAIRVRKIDQRGREFHAGALVGEFPLAATAT